MLVFGSVMIVMMMVRPGGFWPRRRGAVTLRPLLEETEDGAA